ncbi:MAG: patatin-like phospholipase family protein [Solirubrobacterales bacterium]
MKGGITSGVVYPLAAAELAREHHFRNIGGTSAGAIAAAAVAAAERGCRSGAKPDAYEDIAKLPAELGSDLLSLFQPSWRMRPFFDTILSAGGGKLFRIAALFNGFPLAALAGMLPGVGLVVLALTLQGDDGLRYAAVGGGALLAPLGAILAIAASAILRLRGLPKSYYGICLGNDRGENAERPPLTRWLADLLNRLAGKDAEDPLTFGDLWELDGPDDGEPGVVLQMITTCLTQGRPYSLPFEDDEELWFCEDEFRDLFPKEVVDHMVEKARGAAIGPGGAALLRLPEAEDMPVVVAARMSLSFPLLIAAVPLYARNAHEDAGDAPERCWFSDGGISSNMPIHFFDSPVPRWPTYAINLESLPPGMESSTTESDNVWLPESNGDGVAEAWIGAEDRPGVFRTFRFFATIFRTAQNWVDNRQMKGVGNRDRIAHIRLSKGEGGMNLSMDAERIERLGKRGAHAAVRLSERFDPALAEETELNWDNQRWLRFRAYLEMLERRGEKAVRGYNAMGGGTPMRELNRRGPGEPPKFAWADRGQRRFALRASKKLLAGFKAWEQNAQAFEDGAPGPRSEPWLIPRI